MQTIYGPLPNPEKIHKAILRQADKQTLRQSSRVKKNWSNQEVSCALTTQHTIING